MLDQRVILDNNQEYKTNHKTTKRKIKFAKYENTLFFGNPDEGSTTTNNKLHASVSDRTGQISQSLRLPMYTNGFSYCGPISYHSNKTYAYFYFRSCDLKFHSFLYSRKKEYSPAIPHLVLFNRSVCLFIENLHLAEHSKTLSDIQGRVPQFSRKIHLCLLKYYLSKLLIQTNVLFHSVAQTKSYYTICNLSFSNFYWIFVFYI